MSYKDEELGLDDVEFFQEFLKFKKSRAILRARETQQPSDVKAEGTIELGSNPPPPGVEPLPPPPPYIPSPIVPNQEHLNGKGKLPYSKSSLDWLPPDAPIPPRLGDELYSNQDNSLIRERSPRRDRDLDRDRGRPRDYDRNDSRSRRIRSRSRSRDRDSWRQKRRSRSLSPLGRGDRDRPPRRDSREFRLDSRYEPRSIRRRSRSRSREPSPIRSNQYQPQFPEKLNYNYPPPHVPHMQTAPVMHSDWEVPTAGPMPQWDPNIVAVPTLPSAEERARMAAEEQARKLAIEKEAMNQKQTFVAQQREYYKKRENLIIELGLLKSNRRENESSKIPDLQKMNEKNSKLQEEIVMKIKSVDNVLDMLRKLVGDVPKDLSPPITLVTTPDTDKEKKKSKKRKHSRSRSKSKSHASAEVVRRSRSKKREDTKVSDETKSEKSKKHKGEDKARAEPVQQFNYSFYDPEVHWCRACKAFPPTAKEYLLHLHSADHKQRTAERKLAELPWHDAMEHKEPVDIKGLETKRLPIKGLQFFEASAAWFCKLCQVWMGDLHCASLHLKSEKHNSHYQDFVMKNPKWEAAWLSDRGKAAISSGKKEDILKRQLEEQLLLQRKHEYELKLTQEAAAGLVMPLTLPARSLLKADKEKSKKKSGKDKKKSKKKKRDRSSGSSSTSSSSSSSSSSSEDEKHERKKKSRKKSKQKTESIKLPEKSKWEKDDSDESEVVSMPTDLRSFGPRQPRNFRTHDTRHHRPVSPPNVPERHTILIPESTRMTNSRRRSPPPMPRPQPSVRLQSREIESKNEDGESRFDRQTQAAAKKKPTVLPKSKFAFIGRMPFAKRRPEPNEDKDNKGQDVATPDPTAPPPPIISYKVNPVVAPPPVLTTKTKLEVAKGILSKSQNIMQQLNPIQDMRPIDPVVMEVDYTEDMDIEKPEESPPRIELPPSPPKIRPVLPPEVTSNLGKKTMAVPLPKDFQEALSIIYPEQRPVTPPLPPLPPPPSARIPSPPKIDLPPREDTPPLPPSFDIVPPAPSPPDSGLATTIEKMADFDDFDEMELLGIDKEDMAAQRF